MLLIREQVMAKDVPVKTNSVYIIGFLPRVSFLSPHAFLISPWLYFWMNSKLYLVYCRSSSLSSSVRKRLVVLATCLLLFDRFFPLVVVDIIVLSSDVLSSSGSIKSLSTTVRTVGFNTVTLWWSSRASSTAAVRRLLRSSWRNPKLSLTLS